MVARALLDASICIPGPRCISLSSVREDIIGKRKEGVALQEHEELVLSTTGVEHHGHLDIRSRLQKMGLGVGCRNGKRKSSSCTTEPARLGLSPCISTKCARSDYNLSSLGCPQWFTNLVDLHCSDFVRNMSVDTNYGSRPVSSRASNAVFFQVNHCSMCICTFSLSTVPFLSYKTHRNNGVLFCVDGTSIYASCMSTLCASGHIKQRERSLQLSIYIERLYSTGDYNLSTYADRLFSVGEKELLSTLHSKISKCGNMKGDISIVRKVPSNNMDIALDGKRTWIRLNKDIVESFLGII
jgi:hypothetical protein